MSFSMFSSALPLIVTLQRFVGLSTDKWKLFSCGLDSLLNRILIA